MNKRILYALIFTSIFIVSTVSLIAQPAAGAHWKLGIPEQAKGMEVESEVTVYDKDAWKEHLGNDYGDSVKTKFGGDADEVGAKSKMKVNDWEHTEIDFFTDHIMKLEVGKDAQGNTITFLDQELNKYWDAVSLIDSIFEDLSYVNDTDVLNSGITKQIEFSLSLIYSLGFSLGGALDTSHPDTPYMVQLRGQNMQWRTSVGALTIPESIEKFGKPYKGTEIDIDDWDFVEAGDFDSDPDEDDWIRPIIDDPHDYYQIYLQFTNYLDFQDKMIDQIIADIEDVAARLEGCRVGSMGAPFDAVQQLYWNTINSSLPAALKLMLPKKSASNYDEKKALLNDILNRSNPWAVNLTAVLFDALVNATGQNPIQILTDYPAGLKFVKPFIRDLAPISKKEFLAELFEQGIYAMQPVDKYLEKIIDDFNINEDAVWGDDFTINEITAKDDLHKGGIKVEGKQVIIEYEWVDVYNVPEGVEPNPSVDEPRKDYKIIYTYGDTGGQISIEYVGSETFFKIESIAPLIPGYEITILLASAAISALAIIYVVMKKKRM